jgi:pyridoxal 5'-phosphate synthase pdxS subunit
VREVAAIGALPVPMFCAGGIATADASLVMRSARGGVVGSGIFKSRIRCPVRAIVEATTHFADLERVAGRRARYADGLARVAQLAEGELLAGRGW